MRILISALAFACLFATSASAQDTLTDSEPLTTRLGTSDEEATPGVFCTAFCCIVNNVCVWKDPPANDPTTTILSTRDPSALSDYQTLLNIQDTAIADELKRLSDPQY